MKAFFGLTLSAIALSGCGLLDRLPERTPDPVQIPVSYRAPTADGRAIRRVVVLPFIDAANHPSQVAQIESIFVSTLTKRHNFEVIPAAHGELIAEAERDFLSTGVIRKKTLLAMADQQLADAVLYGVVTQYSAYQPISLGLRVDLVSVSAGDVTWSANGLFDSADARVAQDLHNYHDTRLAGTTSLEGWRRLMVSPSRFASYCCSRLIDTY